MAKKVTLKAPQKKWPAPVYADKKMLRTAIYCDNNDTREGCTACLTLLHHNNLTWVSDDYKAIFDAALAHLIDHKEAPSVSSLRSAITDEAVLNEVELLVSLKNPGEGSKGTGDLERMIIRAQDEMLKREHVERLKTEAQILVRGLDVEGGRLQGHEDAKRYALDEIARIEGVAKVALQAATSQGTGPAFPLVVTHKDGSKAPVPGRKENTQAMLEHHGIAVRFNVMNGRREITVPGLEVCTDTEANKSLAHVHELAVGYNLKPSSESLDRHLTLIQEHYHPVAQWVRSEPWDGVPRLHDMLRKSVVLDYSMYGEEDRVHLLTLFTTWFITAMKAALVPLNASEGLAAQGILVFTGVQAARKTRWFRALSPNPDWFFSCGGLDPDKRDSVAAACSAWIVELGEIDATFRRSDISALKNFVTSAKDVYRAPYGREVETHPRRTAFTGSVNDVRYLRDETGSRRFWTVPIKECHPEVLEDLNKNGGLQQVWAEVASMVDYGKQHWLPQETEQWLSRWNQSYEDLPPVISAFLAVWEPLKLRAADMAFKDRRSNNDIRVSLNESYRIQSRTDMQAITSFMRRVWKLEPTTGNQGDMWPIRHRVAASGEDLGQILDATDRFGKSPIDCLTDP